MAFAEYLKDIRVTNDISQVNMAKILEISVTAVKLIENGSTKFPSEKVLSNLANYLNVSKLDVATDILYPNVKNLSKEDEKESRFYLMYRYMTFKYLEGWNIGEQPITYEVKDMEDFIFFSKLSKRRESNNSVLIDPYSVFHLAKKKIILKPEAIGFVAQTLTKIICINDSIRGYQLVFDYRVHDECLAFVVFDALELNRVPFDFEVVLFNPENGEIKKITNLRNKE